MALPLITLFLNFLKGAAGKLALSMLSKITKINPQVLTMMFKKPNQIIKLFKKLKPSEIAWFNKFLNQGGEKKLLDFLNFKKQLSKLNPLKDGQKISELINIKRTTDGPNSAIYERLEAIYKEKQELLRQMQELKDTEKGPERLQEQYQRLNREQKELEKKLNHSTLDPDSWVVMVSAWIDMARFRRDTQELDIMVDGKVFTQPATVEFWRGMLHASTYGYARGHAGSYLWYNHPLWIEKLRPKN